MAFSKSVSTVFEQRFFIEEEILAFTVRKVTEYGRVYTQVLIV